MHFFSKITGGFYDDAFRADYEAAGTWPNDVIEITSEQHTILLTGQSEGKHIVSSETGPVLQDPPAPTPAELIQANVSAIQAELDRQARERGYDNIISACSYAAQAVGAPFQAEGAAFLTWRSAVWTQAYSTLAEVQAGTRELPTPQQAVAEIPTLVLP